MMNHSADYEKQQSADYKKHQSADFVIDFEIHQKTYSKKILLDLSPNFIYSGFYKYRMLTNQQIINHKIQFKILS